MRMKSLFNSVNPKPLLVFLPVTLSLIFAGACGYTLVGTGSGVLTDDIQVIAVPPLAGQMPRVEVQQRLTQSIIDALVNRTGRTVKNEPEGADAVLKGTVQAFQVVPIGWDAQNQVNRFQVTITMEINFIRTSDKKVLFQARGWTFRKQFDLETTASSNYIDRELVALDEISEDFGRAVVSAILEGF